MFGPGFAHYLSYGATDQDTVLQLAGTYTGLLVPGTVAAFQREGTGGFVLTLSATPVSPEYVIDPRFPLFQQALPKAKKSHEALAASVGASELVRTDEPQPEDFTDELIDTIASGWAEFNGSYRSSASGKFAKYAKRLGQPVDQTSAKAPAYVLAPYFTASTKSDPWWSVSKRLFTATASKVSDIPCIRVVAAEKVGALGDLLSDVKDDRVAIWVSGLDELKATSLELRHYADTINRASAAGIKTFALYGGFYSVLMMNVGLGGSSHGIGYGEYRNWIELPTSGPPPKRYYLPQLHRYVQPDEAMRLFVADPRLAQCMCEECNGDPPLGLDYHAMMRHSVRCRAAEIRDWAGLTRVEMADRISAELRDFLEVLDETDLPEVVLSRTQRLTVHLPRWSGALR